jgi:hypothetical protein
MFGEILGVLKRELPILIVCILLSLHPSLEHLIIADPEQMKVSHEANLSVFDFAFSSFSIVSLVPIGKHGGSQLQ